MSNRINFLPPWVETNCQPAFYDLESGTCLQQTARMYAKVNQLIRNFNELSDEVKDYINQFVELRTYVEEYFDNLDVQEEVNTKLNEMAEDGTLQEIIVNYIQDQMLDNVEFLFNEQLNLNESYYSVTSDVTPVADKFYYIPSDNPLASNGKTPIIGSEIGTFDPLITYYERSAIDSTTGECLTIKVNDKTVMIDTGGTNRKEPILQYLQDNNISKIDYLIISHYHADHTGNLAYLAANGIDFTECTAYLPLEAPSLAGQTYDTTIATIDTLGITKVFPDEGDTLNIGNVNLTFYNCGATAFNEITSQYGARTRKINDYSMMTLVNYFNTNVLYSGDLEQVGQERVYSKHFFANKTIDLYKWHHHGVDTLDDVYLPYLKEISPREIVIVKNTSNAGNTDEGIFNATVINYAYAKTLIWKSNGNVIKQDKSVFPVYELKNRVLCTNEMTLNNIREFICIRSVDVYKAVSLLLRLSDNQNNKFDTLLRIHYKIGTSPVNITNMSVETISNKGSICGQDMVYLAQDGDSVRVFFKKTTNNITVVASLIDATYGKSTTFIEPSYNDYSSEDFEAAYPDAYHHPYFNLLTLNTDYFQSSADNPLVYRKVNGMVEISGSITTVASVSTSGEYICDLPDEIAPRSGAGFYTFVMPSNAVNKWVAQIETNSATNKKALRFSRYGSSSSTTAGTGIWMPICITYMSDN